jgi:hypothetical protein
MATMSYWDAPQASQQSSPTLRRQSLSTLHAEYSSFCRTSHAAHCPPSQLAARLGLSIVAHPHMGPWHEHCEAEAWFMATKSVISGVPHRQQLEVANTHWPGPLQPFSVGSLQASPPLPPVPATAPLPPEPPTELPPEPPTALPPVPEEPAAPPEPLVTDCPPQAPSANTTKNARAFLGRSMTRA